MPKRVAIWRASLLAVLILVAGGDAHGNAVPQYSLKKKVQLSDLVFLGHVVSLRSEGANSTGRKFANVRVDTMLKGDAREYVEVLFRGTIAEFDPDCCEVGKGYLFFVAKLKDGGAFGSINGPFGVYPLQGR